jgi:hypothetical protein
MHYQRWREDLTLSPSTDGAAATQVPSTLLKSQTRLRVANREK